MLMPKRVKRRKQFRGSQKHEWVPEKVLSNTG